MTPDERRNGILKVLEETETPLSATKLARQFGVSRQIIVGDVALLRASEIKIFATPRGYVLNRDSNSQKHTIACRHESLSLLQKELYLVVDNGCGLIDVIVDHDLYGQIIGQLHIFSRHDADEFLSRLNKTHSVPLSALTGGVHLHTLSCPDEASFGRVLEELKKSGILFEENL
ncbi:MAG: transcription repressor NadR [Clostridiales bacterium]|jgi:transcriptional regulator of NAD metabolism|nr:transcription repressor NadR [Clostridiales bacterium]MCI2161024.1 transcription repressor NadR [Oscillospiraceae bacterium]CAB1239725.1 putative transcription repressor NiaR [Ruminococcaceae bacterium BL-4]MCI1961165.1 transcription repressor NadR [Clostridiales bacterium]MCI2021606.1 transcription repressor NadR [Clostridiales bacterium]